MEDDPSPEPGTCASPSCGNSRLVAWRTAPLCSSRGYPALLPFTLLDSCRARALRVRMLSR